MDRIDVPTKQREPWNKAKLVGQKAPLKLKEIWAIRIRLQLAARIRDLVLTALALIFRVYVLRAGIRGKRRLLTADARRAGRLRAEQRGTDAIDESAHAGRLCSTP